MSQTRFEYDVFLSHSPKDKPTVRELANRLKSDGLRVWLDEWNIKAGDKDSQIQQGIEQSRTLVICMSPDFFASEWAKIEHHSLLFRDTKNQQRLFIPLLLSDCEIPDMIAQFKSIDWREKSNKDYQELLNTWRSNEELIFKLPETKAGTQSNKLSLEKHIKKRVKMSAVLKEHNDEV